MVTKEFSPGPWKHIGRFVENGDHKVILSAPNSTTVFPWERVANVRLAAAAPRLLKALEEILDYEDVLPPLGSRGREIYDSANAVIREALGVDE